MDVHIKKTEVDSSRSASSEKIIFDKFIKDKFKTNCCCICKKHSDITSGSFRKSLPVFCDLCFKDMMKISKINWLENINKVYGKCTICYNTICFEQNFIVHDCTNTGNIYSCKSCGVLYFNNEDLLRHVNKCNNILLKNVETEKKCLGVRNASSDSGSSRSININKQSDIVNINLIHNYCKKSFACPKCIKSFSVKANLLTHLRTHTGEKPFACPNCSKSFSQNGNLIRHLRTHTGEKPFACPNCSKSFPQKSSLIYHLRLHSGEKPFACPNCTKSFSQKKLLIYHLRTHSVEKLFACQICSKSFYQKRHLINHSRMHTGKKYFECPDCGKSFSRKSNLIQHLRTHTGEKPYACTNCSKSFARKSTLIYHLRTHTGTNR